MNPIDMEFGYNAKTHSYGKNAMIFSVTPIYTLVVALIWLILWFRVRNRRAELKQSIGDGGDAELLLRIRQHGNCSEWAGFLLLLMIVAEGSGATGVFLHISGVLLIIGRIAHPFGLKTDVSGHPMRYVGNATNLVAAVVLIVLLAVGVVTG